MLECRASGRTLREFRRGLLAACAAVALLGAPAFAQDEETPAEAEEPGVADDAETEDVIVVTARRTEETLQSTPVAVSAFGEEDLSDRLVFTLEGLQGNVPNLNIVQGRGSSSSANIFIRGIGQPDALSTFDPGVGVYVDDVYISRIRGALFDIYDVERIEVLRGPQGTLYGKNTIAGAIKLVSRLPDEEFRAFSEVTYGSYDRGELRARVAGPIDEDWLYASASFFWADRDGFVEDPITGKDYNDKETVAGRATLVAEPTAASRYTLHFDYTRERPGITLGRHEAPLVQTELAANLTFAGPLAPFPNNIPLFTPTSVLEPAPTGEFDFETSTTIPQNRQDLDHFGISLKGEWDLSPSTTLKSISAYRNLEYDDFIDIDASVFRLGDVFVGVDQQQFSQELQLLYSNDRFNMVSGLFYLRENVESDQIAFGDDIFTASLVIPSYPPLVLTRVAGPFPVTFRRDISDDLELDSFAAFAHGTYALTDRISLSAGLRYTYEKKVYERATTVDSTGVLDFINEPDFAFAFEQDESWQAATPSFTLDYQATDDALLYASIGRGFKSGGINGRANSPGEEQPYDPEFVTTYEVGAKTQWWEGMVTANLALFLNKYQDFQARVARGDAFNVVFAVLNAGKLTTKGAELELMLQPWENGLISANVGYLDAQYDEFFDTDPTTGNIIDRSDDVVPFSPEWNVGAYAQQIVPLADVANLVLAGAVKYRSEQWLSVDNQPGLVEDGYVLVDLSATLETFDGRYYLKGGVKNLTDEVYKTDAQEFSSVAN
ncbi:MAG: TonB-dependent receptor, partial [Alphaproteobacteria bacterium]